MALLPEWSGIGKLPDDLRAQAGAVTGTLWETGLVLEIRDLARSIRNSPARTR